jgi:hypothetical protein
MVTLFSAAATTTSAGADDSKQYGVVLVSRSVSQSCGSRDAKRELSVCHDAKGCYRLNLNPQSGVQFTLPAAGSFSLVVHGPLADARTAFRTGEEIPERVTQVLEGYGDCTMSFTYVITR